MLSKNFSRTNYILTEGCNLNCDFCFQQESKRTSKQLTEEEILKYTNFTIKHLKVEDKNNFHMNIIGGEPLLFKNFSIMNKVIDIFISNGIKPILTIFTNGTIWNDAFIEFCKYANGKVDKIIITTNDNYFDEYPNRIQEKYLKNFYNNINRFKKDLPFVKLEILPIFDRTIKNSYQKIIEYNILNDYKKNVNFAEYSKKDKNLTENDFYNFTKIFLNTLKKNNIDIFKCDYNAEKSKLVTNLIESSGLIYLHMFLNKNYKQHEKNKTCRPLVKEFGISPGGFITPCSRALAFKTDFPNIHNKEQEILKQLEKYANKDFKLQQQSEEGQNCFECLLKRNCLSCKIMPFGYIEKDGIFYTSKEKCKYQLDQFNGQYRGLKDFIEES